ncbi:MAG TPA: MBL fold metallo-hydrolase [Actinomycetes bacterium]|nr:MBL fold metallo-hydrolase [Actinomycetes bacterium]
MSVLDALPDGVVGIDTHMGGLPEITAGYLVLGERPALVETGPARVASVVAEGVAKAGLAPADLGWIVLSHIHLDHGGGVGDLVRTFPNATVVVHPFGARHLVDPERLLASSARVYGELMGTVYGGLTPVEASRIKAVEDGEVIDLGGRRLELLHAPGHARHHMGVFEPDAGTLFAGDGAGVLLPGSSTLRPATPPPDFDRDQAVRSLRTFAARSPAHLVLTHFGPISPPAERLAEAEERLLRWCDTAETAAREHGPEIDHIEAALRERFEREEGHESGDPDRFRLLNSYESNAAGFARWIGKRQAATEQR